MSLALIGSAQNADRNLTTLVSIFDANPLDSTNARFAVLAIDIGDGTKNLNGAGGEFFIRVEVGGVRLFGLDTVIQIAALTRFRHRTEPILVPANTRLQVFLSSPNSADTDVDTTVTAYDVEPPGHTKAERLDATVSSRLPTSSYTAPDNTNIAAAAADAAELNDTKITTARAAKLDNVAQEGADGDTLKTLSDQVDGISGGDNISDDLAAIKAQTDLITSNNVFTRSRITSDGSIEIFRGESLSDANGTAIHIPKPSGATWPTDLTGYTVTFKARKYPFNEQGGIDELEKAMTIETATGASQQVMLELLASESTGLALGVNGWEFEVIADDGTDVSVLMSGSMTVLEIIP